MEARRQYTVLANVDVDKEDTVFKSLEDIQGVAPYKVYGIYDFVLEVSAPTAEEAKNIIERVRCVKGVRSTVTHKCIYE